MHLLSASFSDGQPIPDRYAAGQPDAQATVTFSDNLNPHLEWDDVPEGTQSFVLICCDPDAPSVGDDVNQPDREVPEDLPRTDFFHWVLVDLPTRRRAIAEGEFSAGFTPRGKPGPEGPDGTRQGLNDYTGWFAGDLELAGEYHGYDGPFPPYNDARVHDYIFTLFALDVPRCPVERSFTGAQVRQALRGHVLAKASLMGTYTLNIRLR